jgi:hypothetical protein
MIRFDSIRFASTPFHSVPLPSISSRSHHYHYSISSIGLQFNLPFVLAALKALWLSCPNHSLTWLGLQDCPFYSIWFLFPTFHHPLPPSSSSFPKPRTPLSLAAAFYSAFVLVFHCFLFPISFQRLLVNLSLHSIYSLHLPTPFTHSLFSLWITSS